MTFPPSSRAPASQACMWMALALANVLISAAAGYGTYRWAESRGAAAISVEDMASVDDEAKDEEDMDVDADGRDGSPKMAAAGTAGAAPALSPCDSLAADPDDPDRAQEDGGRVAGTLGKDLDIAAVLAACPKGTIHAGLPVAELRVQYQRARALIQGGRFQDAVDSYLALCDASYGAACFRLAQAARNGSANVNQDDGIALAYAQKAAALNVAAAGDLLQDLAPLVNPGNRLQARGLVEPLLRGDLAAIPDTVSTRRYFYTLFMQSEKQNAQWYVGMMSNQDNLHARQTIWPVLQSRLRLTTDEAKKIYDKFGTQASSDGDWRIKLDAAARGVIEMRTFVQNVDSVQVVVGAQDAQKLFEWFSGCSNCSAREAYQRNMSMLMAQWSGAVPGADRDDICRLLFRDGRPDCLPLGDYEGSDGSKGTDIFRKPGSH